MSIGAASASSAGHRFGPGAKAAVALVLAAFSLLLLAALGGGSLSEIGAESGEAPEDGVSALARREIPPEYLRLYEQAAQRYGIDWAILAGIGRVECDHGRDPDRACNSEGVVNSAGAGGPMQFIASTWARYGVDAEGDGPPDRWNPADAVFAAANYLRAAGAPGDYEKAILAYNHAVWYLEDVESWAARYRGAATAETALTGLNGGETDGGADVELAAETSTSVRFSR
jgi:soluble lytic murein transglycosylase-like protein